MASQEPIIFDLYNNRQESAPIIYNSFAGTDISAQIIVPNESEPLNLGELQTISYSIHRENKPVRVLGRVSPKGFVKGPRTIAGSMIFTVFNSYAFYRLAQYKKLIYGASGAYTLAQTPMFPLADMLPPFDMVITMSNEYGRFARMKILGITIVDEGGTMSIEDLITEGTFTYMARHIQPMTAYVPENVAIIDGDLLRETKPPSTFNTLS
jgi:hypothetical protein